MSSKILIVTDDDKVKPSIIDILKTNNFLSLEASDSNKAIDIFVNEKPDVVLIDLKMRAKDGFETMNQIKRIDAQIPIIIITTICDISIAVEAVKSGAYDFILKPVDIKERLIITTQRAVERLELERKYNRLSAKQKSTSKMIGVIAHKWMQPVNTIALLIQDLEDSYESGQLDKNYISDAVKQIMKQIEYMAEIIDELRDFFHENEKSLPNSPKPLVPKIMVVDDVIESLDIIGRLIKRISYDPILVMSGQEALKLFDKYNQEIKLVVMDIQLDDMDGKIVAEKMRKKMEDWHIDSIPIIAVSASTDDAKKNILKSNLFDDYLQKPIELDLIKLNIEKYVSPYTKY